MSTKLCFSIDKLITCFITSIIIYVIVVCRRSLKNEQCRTKWFNIYNQNLLKTPKFHSLKMAAKPGMAPKMEKKSFLVFLKFFVFRRKMEDKKRKTDFFFFHFCPVLTKNWTVYKKSKNENLQPIADLKYEIYI